MSSWTLLHALTGITYSVELNQFSIGPKINPSNFQSFFITNSAWGTVNQQVTEEMVLISLYISYGELPLKSIRIAFFDKIGVRKIKSCKIVNSEENIIIDANLNINDSILELFLLKPITLKENQKLQIQLERS